MGAGIDSGVAGRARTPPANHHDHGEDLPSPRRQLIDAIWPLRPASLDDRVVFRSLDTTVGRTLVRVVSQYELNVRLV